MQDLEKTGMHLRETCRSHAVSASLAAVADVAAEAIHRVAINIAGATAAVVIGSATNGVIRGAADGAAAVGAAGAITGPSGLTAAEDAIGDFIVTAGNCADSAADFKCSTVRVAV